MNRLNTNIWNIRKRSKLNIINSGIVITRRLRNPKIIELIKYQLASSFKSIQIINVINLKGHKYIFSNLLTINDNLAKKLYGIIIACGLGKTHTFLQGRNQANDTTPLSLVAY